MKILHRLTLLACSLLASCGSPTPLTQIVVVVDTNLAVPAQLNRVRVNVVGPSGATMEQRIDVLNTTMDLPSTLGVVHRGGELEPLRITAVGFHGDTEVVRQAARTEFALGRTLVLSLTLGAECVGVLCEGEQTCVSGQCEDPYVPSTSLPDYVGTIPRNDAGIRDGCMPLPELCNGADDDCDGRVDENFDFTSDENHCGRCGNNCPARAQAQPLCQNAQCGISCGLGYGDCDEDPRNGCEVELSSLTMCGGCNQSCAVDHGTPTCVTAMCAVDFCAPGWGDCNTDVSDGCEAPLNTLVDCTGCGRPCALEAATATCAGGTACRIAECNEGFANCDGRDTTGCETALGTVSDCATCGDACEALPHAVVGCMAGRCGIASCITGWGNCDGMASNGCETALNTLNDCGECGSSCALDHASESCATGTCTLVACDSDWGNCDTLGSTGCETSLSTTEDCGACDVTCSGATPLCSADVSGARMCRSICATGQTLCGGTQCANLETSLEHCGECGRLCAPPHAVPMCTGGSCGIASCEPGWGNCNGMIGDGCETSLDTLANCGGCGMACSLPSAAESCASGRCTIAMCDPNTADCDEMTSTGCEANLRSLSTCGSCGTPCDLPHASESCATGTCTLAACDPGWGDCNDVASDGCETRLNTLTDCGMCNRTCALAHASESCTSGTCTLSTCDSGYGDCDSMTTTGCETNLHSVSDCGMCGRTCSAGLNATATCPNGTCGQVCAANFGDCDSMPATGCETRLDSLQHCGACNQACPAPSNATVMCTAMGTCSIANCALPMQADCDRRADTGCEVDLATSATDCGMCGHPCASDQTCQAGVCS